MQIDMTEDCWITLWRHLDKQPMTEDDRASLEAITADIREVVFNPLASIEKKRGRPVGSRNKKQGPEPLFPPGSTYSGEDDNAFIRGDLK